MELFALVEREVKRANRGRVTVGLVLILVAWLVLPTGDASDVFVTVPLATYLGLKAFVALCLALVLALWFWFFYLKRGGKQ